MCMFEYARERVSVYICAYVRACGACMCARAGTCVCSRAFVDLSNAKVVKHAPCILSP